MRLREREALVMGEAAGAAGAQASVQGKRRGETRRLSRSCSAHGQTFGAEGREGPGQSRTASSKGIGRRGAREQRVAPRCIWSGSRVARQRRRGRSRSEPGAGSGARQRGWKRGRGE